MGAVIQRVRVDGIVARNNASTDPDPRFSDTAGVRDFLGGLEASEGDCPLHLAQDLELLREAASRSPRSSGRSIAKSCWGEGRTLGQEANHARDPPHSRPRGEDFSPAADRRRQAPGIYPVFLRP